jgi:hypothetical protein
MLDQNRIGCLSADAGELDQFRHCIRTMP